MEHHCCDAGFKRFCKFLKRVFLSVNPEKTEIEFDQFWSKKFKVIRLGHPQIFPLTIAYSGKWFVGSIKVFKRNGRYFGSILDCKVTEHSLNSFLALGNLKPFYLELTIRTLTELGIDCVCLVKLARSVTSITDGIRKRLERLVVEHSSIIGRLIPLEVRVFNGLSEFLDEVGSLSETRVLLHPSASIRLSLDDIQSRGIYFIGPEGDFTPDELDLLKQSGFKFRNLGNFILTSWATASLLSSLDYFKRVVYS